LEQRAHKNNRIASLGCGDAIHLRTAVGGNIGTGMLDMVQQQDTCDIGVIELSSFQLELNKKFAPDIALWTNLCPNHLDRHHTMYEYFQAKCNILRFQREHQVAVLSSELFEGQNGVWLREQLPSMLSTLCVCATKPVTTEFITSIKVPHFFLFHVVDSSIVVSRVTSGRIDESAPLIHMDVLPDVTFVQNWIPIMAVLHVVGLDMGKIHAYVQQHGSALLSDQHHRLEHFSTIRGVDFYDDSKSTVIESTYAAFEKLSAMKRPIILILGGLSKGVDRSPLATMLQSHPSLKKLYCFGNDCAAFGSSIHCATLEDVVQNVATIMKEGDVVLFSPSGTSFDFFKNYAHRGQVFKELIKKLA
jgi:UDP-N-acetylmuramoylalanine--D-glutamate ligase